MVLRQVADAPTPCAQMKMSPALLFQGKQKPRALEIKVPREQRPSLAELFHDTFSPSAKAYVPGKGTREVRGSELRKYLNPEGNALIRAVKVFLKDLFPVQ